MNNKIVVAQYWTSNLLYGKFTKEINETYCKERGYVYHLENDSNKINRGREDRSVHWWKIKFVAEVLEQYNPEYVLFMDADAVFNDYKYTIEQFIDSKYDMIAAEDNGSCKLNTGVMIFKNTDWVKRLLKDWWDIGHNNPLYKTNLWHEQTCFGILLDSNPEFNTKVKIVSSREINWIRAFDSNFIFHAFCYGNLPMRTIDAVYYKMFNKEIPIAGNKLSDIAVHFGTDKHYLHNYFTRAYDDIFLPLRGKINYFVEIGVLNGDSLRLWKKYLNCKVTGVDINKLNASDIEVLQCDQSNEQQLAELSEKIKDCDVILDDGSHKMYDQQKTLGILFKSLKPGGIYILEDLHTSIECPMPEKAWLNWGDPKKTITLEMLWYFKRTGKIVSDYLTPEECRYLEENIEEVTIYDDIHSSITSCIKKKDIVRDKVYVVYNCFLVKRWKELVTEQMNRLKEHGLLDGADKVYIEATDTDKTQRGEFLALIGNYKNVEVNFYDNNCYEYYGIHRVWELAQRENCKIMYFHTKGVWNDFILCQKEGENFSDLKVRCIKDWRRLLEYACIDLWKENLVLLDKIDMVGATHNYNWWWGNFWWAHSRHIKRLEEPQHWGRWGYEAWSNQRGLATVHEHAHMDYQPYFTYFPDEFYNRNFVNKYKGSKLIIHSAYYGNNGIQVDEGRPLLPDGCKLDVTNLIKENVEKNKGLYIEFVASNTSTGGDPCFMVNKNLHVRYSFECEPDNIFEACGDENKLFKFPYFNV